MEDVEEFVAEFAAKVATEVVVEVSAIAEVVQPQYGANLNLRFGLEEGMYL